MHTVFVLSRSDLEAPEALARISHQLPTAGGDVHRPETFSHLRVLQPTLTTLWPHAWRHDCPAGSARGPYGLNSTPPRPSNRKLHWTLHLATLVTEPGEICGLDHARCGRGIGRLCTAGAGLKNRPSLRASDHSTVASRLRAMSQPSSRSDFRSGLRTILSLLAPIQESWTGTS